MEKTKFLVSLSEFFLFREKVVSTIIIYNNLELVHSDIRQELLNELNMQFGISEVKDVKIGRIDTTKNSVRLLITFKDTDNTNLPEDQD